MERGRAFWNFSDQINGIPLVWHLKNQPDGWNSIGLVPEKLARLMGFHSSGTWKVDHQIKSSGWVGQSAQRRRAARSTYMRKVEKWSYNSIDLAQLNPEMRAQIITFNGRNSKKKFMMNIFHLIDIHKNYRLLAHNKLLRANLKLHSFSWALYVGKELKGKSYLLKIILTIDSQP